MEVFLLFGVIGHCLFRFDRFERLPGCALGPTYNLSLKRLVTRLIRLYAARVCFRLSTGLAILGARLPGF